MTRSVTEGLGAIGIADPPQRPPLTLRKTPNVSPPRVVSAEPEPMQLGRSGISGEERQYRLKEGLCLYCADGTFPVALPQTTQEVCYAGKRVSLETPERRVLGTTVLSLITAKQKRRKSCLVLPVSVAWEHTKLDTEVLIDLGSTGNFLDSGFAATHQVPLVERAIPLVIESIDGRQLQRPHVNYETIPLSVGTGILHEEKMRFQIIQSSTVPIVLGYPWLAKHNPALNWKEGELSSWGPKCWSKCLGLNAIVGSLNVATAPPLSTNVPEWCIDLKEVFDKGRSEILPPHRPYDCAIDLLPGTMPPRGHVYPLSQKENDIMEEYIRENLARGFIRRSSSPAGAEFFFVSKKEGDLRPCID
uniref:Uncharacterized protein n=1 Tax=Leptobrachium leishanense TaxID=445787 RepID=A0A8C5PCX1_9ANUR